MAVEMSEVFWSFFITSMIGLLLKGGSMLYKSKCKTVECCCIKIERDIEAEVAVDVLPPPNLMASASV
jgi:hypothetical protein|nr:MAG: hypothetical protein [Lake Baikal virophage 6]